MTRNPTSGARIAAMGLVGALLGLGGCYGYASYPVVDGQVAVRNPNAPPMGAIMTEALRWTVSRDAGLEGGSQFVVGLPIGLTRESYLETVHALGPNALPLTPATEHLPTYHIGRVWIRGNRAKVDVVRPAFGDVPTTNGAQPTQGLTVYLESRVSPWRVVRNRVWAMGTLDMPPPSYLPGGSNDDFAGVDSDGG